MTVMPTHQHKRRLYLRVDKYDKIDKADKHRAYECPTFELPQSTPPFCRVGDVRNSLFQLQEACYNTFRAVEITSMNNAGTLQHWNLNTLWNSWTFYPV
jgi:hypothetical protein